MEKAVLEAFEEVDEDFGRPEQLPDGTERIMCVNCGRMLLANWQQFWWHVDYSVAHRRRSKVCIRRAKAAIATWEQHRRLLRRKRGLDE